MSVRVNFGCGSIQPEGWYNVDIIAEFKPDYLRLEDLNLAENTVDYIVAHHALHMTPWHELTPLLERLRYILKPDGFLRISIPDVLGAFKAYKKKDLKWFPNHHNERDIDDAFCSYLTWYSTCTTPMTAKTLCSKLGDAGFKEILLTEFGNTEHPDTEILSLDSRKGESIYIEAIK